LNRAGGEKGGQKHLNFILIKGKGAVKIHSGWRGQLGVRTVRLWGGKARGKKLKRTKGSVRNFLRARGPASTWVQSNRRGGKEGPAKKTTSTGREEFESADKTETSKVRHFRPQKWGGEEFSTEKSKLSPEEEEYTTEEKKAAVEHFQRPPGEKTENGRA